MSLIGEIVIALMALTVGSHGVVNGDWLGWVCLLCYECSISDLVVDNCDCFELSFVSIKGWFGGDSGLLVRVACEL